jgi:hypothetical protein
MKAEDDPFFLARARVIGAAAMWETALDKPLGLRRQTEDALREAVRAWRKEPMGGSSPAAGGKKRKPARKS